MPPVYYSNSSNSTCKVYYDRAISSGTIEVIDRDMDISVAKKAITNNNSKDYLEISDKFFLGSYTLKTYNVKDLNGNAMEDCSKNFSRYPEKTESQEAGKVVKVEVDSNSSNTTCKVYYDRAISSGTIEVIDRDMDISVAKKAITNNNSKDYLEISGDFFLINYTLKTYNVKDLNGNAMEDCSKNYNGYSEKTESQEVAVTGLSLNKTSLTLRVGETATLTATVTPSNATNKSVKWGSNSFGTGSITVYDGVITAYAAGTYRVTAQSSQNNKVTATCTVIVEESQILGDVNMDWKVTRADLTRLREYLDNYNFVDLSNNIP